MSALRVTLAFRVVAAGWLFGWFCKAGYYARALLWDDFAARLDVAGFSPLVQHPLVIAVAWLAPLAVVPALVWPRPRAQQAAAALMLVASLVACIHLETFNDATFVTSFWVALWLLWLTIVAPIADEATTLRHARRLAQCIVGVIFLGGAMGKLTPEHIDGDVLLHVYFLGKDTFPYPQLRGALTPEHLAALARAFSRIVIVAELLLAASPLLPFRISTILGATIMTLMIAGSSLYLVSVLACLLALLGGAALLSAAGGTRPLRT